MTDVDKILLNSLSGPILLSGPSTGKNKLLRRLQHVLQPDNGTVDTVYIGHTYERTTLLEKIADALNVDYRLKDNDDGEYESGDVTASDLSFDDNTSGSSRTGDPQRSRKVRPLERSLSSDSSTDVISGSDVSEESSNAVRGSKQRHIASKVWATGRKILVDRIRHKAYQRFENDGVQTLVVVHALDVTGVFTVRDLTARERRRYFLDT
ncbi:hypothetical protein HDU76_002293, partial [Blyttiomyces sp. JEL0837]